MMASATVPESTGIGVEGQGLDGAPWLDAHVVVLCNYFRPHHVAVYQAVKRRVRKLTVLLSTPMESDRNWHPDWGDLDVIVQKNLTWNTRWKSRFGFSMPNYIHFPLDTPYRLQQLRPDVIFSYEFGIRTLLSGAWRVFSRSTPLVTVGNMSHYIERERGFARRVLRSMIRRMADYFTYNGPGCLRTLRDMKIPEDRCFFFPYYLDEGKVFRGEKCFSRDGWRRVVFSGVLDRRKGIVELIDVIRRWKSTASEKARNLELVFCGAGEFEGVLAGLASDRVRIRMMGNVGDEVLRRVYAESDFCIYPSLADEWGLVPVECMQSGTPVLGSKYAQSVEVLIEDRVNGWLVDPLDSEQFLRVFSSAMELDEDSLEIMGSRARASTSHITADWASQWFCRAAKTAMESHSSRRHGRRRSSSTSSRTPAASGNAGAG